MSKKLKLEIAEFLEVLSTAELRQAKLAIEAIAMAQAEEESPLRIVRSVKDVPARVEKKHGVADVNNMSKQEQREYLKKLHVSRSAAGEDMARFLKRVFKMANTTTEKQLIKMAEKKGVDFVFGRGRQTPEGKREKMAAQLITAH
jgi:mannose/fructose/N-acetylgalactosamine-specific phosphotransferase system component IIB